MHSPPANIAESDIEPVVAVDTDTHIAWPACAATMIVQAAKSIAYTM